MIFEQNSVQYKLANTSGNSRHPDFGQRLHSLGVCQLFDGADY